MLKKEESGQVAAPKTDEKKNTGITNIFVLIVSLIFIGMSALMIFVEGVEISYLCYGICLAAIVIGIYYIVRYFMTDAYKNMNAYGFSGGTLLVILGICGVIRADKMAGAFLVILGIILLLSGVFVLQHSLDLRRLDDVIWIPALIISVLVLICSVMVIVEPFAGSIDYSTVSWWMIMIAGGLGVLINIYTMIKVAIFRKKEEKAALKSEENNTASTEEKTSDSDQKPSIGETGDAAGANKAEAEAADKKDSSDKKEDVKPAAENAENSKDSESFLFGNEKKNS